MYKKEGGFWEWVGWFSNWCNGCIHNCKYCYSMIRLICRLKKLSHYTDYARFELKKPTITLRNGHSITKIKKLEGWGMLPGTHDIFPEILDETISYFRTHLEIGNKLLIVSKPHLECIQALIKEFKEYKDQIHFRFTITTHNDSLINIWEENAPLYHERLDCLMYAFHKGFHTSVSIGPFLDKDPLPLITTLEKFTTEIWLEPINHLHHIKKIVSIPYFEYACEITSQENLIQIVKDLKSTLTPEIRSKIHLKKPFDPILELLKNQTLTKWIELKNE